MSEPFKTLCLLDAPLWKRIFGLKAKFNAVIELNNVLARSNDVRDVPISKIDQINQKYSCVLLRSFKEDIWKLYIDFVRFCFRNGEFSEDEAKKVDHLQKLFMLTDHDVSLLNEQAGRAVYRDKVSIVLADGVLSESERLYLEKLSEDLNISEKARKDIYTEEAQKKFQSMLDTFVSDGMLSPEEEAKLEAFRKNLSASLQFDFNTAESLRKFKLMWQIRKGELPVIDPGISLQRGEICHYRSDCEWHEMRKQRIATAYAGPTMRVKIAKGLYYRMGTLAHAPISVDSIVKIDTGKVFITNKRLIFMGVNKNVSLKLDKILDITPFSDAVKIDKDTGRTPFLFTDDAVFLAAFLARLVGV
jgi:Chloroplast envelope transporter